MWNVLGVARVLHKQSYLHSLGQWPRRCNIHTFQNCDFPHIAGTELEHNILKTIFNPKLTLNTLYSAFFILFEIIMNTTDIFICSYTRTMLFIYPSYPPMMREGQVPSCNTWSRSSSPSQGSPSLPDPVLNIVIFKKKNNKKMSNNTSFNNVKYFEYSIVMYCTVYNAHM